MRCPKRFSANRLSTVRRVCLRWRFTCCCEACSSTSTSESNASRLRLAELDASLRRNMELCQEDVLAAAVVGQLETETLAQVAEMTELLSREFGPHPALRCQLYYDAFQLMLMLKKPKNTLMFISMAVKASYHAVGETSEQSGRFKGYLDNPCSHSAFLTGRQRS
ncbi:unnamed protein product [Polarella glacialis]|uniref:Uncharacterized protein n=1 Tax=Polarella glacialis TaxID=89957 RepID=A0A813JCW5_POLGL|nr:unnamed protein product [Polarella glacialis]